MDKKKNNKNKINLSMLKGKSMNTSVPTISIRFNATAEELEELHFSDSEHCDSGTNPPSDHTVSDIEGSPSKSIHASKIAKRSTSIDIANTLNASPPTDPWRFFSDIKGKITKSVEGRLTEYKTRSNDCSENSPKTARPTNKDGGKDSLSDSEELSESSISKTCGILSTTEGAEMSSDDETPSLSEKEKNAKDVTPTKTKRSLRRKLVLVKDDQTKKEHTVNNKFLENISQISMGIELDQQPSQYTEDGVDALAQIENIEIADEAVIIKQRKGVSIKDKHDSIINASTIFSPVGFVDLREPRPRPTVFSLLKSLKLYIFIASLLCIYFSLSLSPYMYGFLAGNIVMFSVCFLYSQMTKSFDDRNDFKQASNQQIYEIPAAKEYTPASRFQGWVNEYPDKYDPHSYHVSQTQSVFLKLHGNLLKISHTKAKIPKRAMWNEPEHNKATFYRHRIYNLLGAKVDLLPNGLTRIRHWSKKYPICITLDNDQFKFDDLIKKKGRVKKNEHVVKKASSMDSLPVLSSDTSSKFDTDYLGLNEEEQAEVINEPDQVSDTSKNDEDVNSECISMYDDYDVVSIDSNAFTAEDDNNKSPTTKIYLFSRTSREKEVWFKRLKAATRYSEDQETINVDSIESITEEYKGTEILHAQYLKFMTKSFMAQDKFRSYDSDDNASTNSGNLFDYSWLNTTVARVTFDLIRNDFFLATIKERVQKKLTSIKLPYFIEDLTITELSLGNSAPRVLKIEKPVMDEWGLWLNAHIEYEGNVVISLVTKLNLMKLKQQQQHAPTKNTAKSPIFHSDVEDTAESSTDDDFNIPIPSTPPVLDATGTPLPGVGGTSYKSKRFIRIVDKIAESKLFQAATENKYIKKAIEGVSNTEIRLKLEMKSLKGVAILNIPTPPSDRVWISFQPTPKLNLTAYPCVGERNINFLHITNLIEKRIHKEFQKILVFPNMEDLSIPMMLYMLPD